MPWAGLALCAALALAAQAQETLPIERSLADLVLGDALETIQKVYPPEHDWPSSIEPRTRTRRHRVGRRDAKKFPPRADVLWLGLRKGRLLEIQLIYDAEHTSRTPVEALVSELSLTYGEPRRTGARFWWSDGDTVLRVFYAEVPVLKDGSRAVELRTSLQLLDESLFLRRGPS